MKALHWDLMWRCGYDEAPVMKVIRRFIFIKARNDSNMTEMKCWSMQSTHIDAGAGEEGLKNLSKCQFTHSSCDSLECEGWESKHNMQSCATQHVEEFWRTQKSTGIMARKLLKDVSHFIKHVVLSRPIKLDGERERKIINSSRTAKFRADWGLRKKAFCWLFMAEIAS